MGRIPALTPDDVIRALHKLGFEVVRQRGSHLKVETPGPEDRDGARSRGTGLREGHSGQDST